MPVNENNYPQTFYHLANYFRFTAYNSILFSVKYAKIKWIWVEFSYVSVMTFHLFTKSDPLASVYIFQQISNSSALRGEL